MRVRKVKIIPINVVKQEWQRGLQTSSHARDFETGFMCPLVLVCVKKRAANFWSTLKPGRLFTPESRTFQ